MCGIAAIAGPGCEIGGLKAMLEVQRHRGPDDSGAYFNPEERVALGHNRLSIIDLSPAGHQPMANGRNDVRIVFNGEIYNYLELKDELKDYEYSSRTDTEVILAAYERWGEDCLDHFRGMFAFVIWDARKQQLFAARDRFGVKPLYYHLSKDGKITIGSEIKALHAANVPVERDPVSWASYLTFGVHDHSSRSFWKGISALPAGCALKWRAGETSVRRWYDLASRVGPDLDERPTDSVIDEYLDVLMESLKLRFRSDVPVGINLSGGLDSSALLGLVQRLQGPNSQVKAFTYISNDPNYDELPWTKRMLEHTKHPCSVVPLSPGEVPELAQSVYAHEDEPFGGLPTLAYAKLHARARAEDVIVLLDGQGMDEQWGGYDYYAKALSGGRSGIVQATKESPVRPDCLCGDFRGGAEPLEAETPFPDLLRNIQYRDICYTKIPRALRFNDRVSMRASAELREPFLDHKLIEIALRQPPERKIQNGTHKWLLRKLAARLLPQGIVEAPKRPVQTPQREWLRGELRPWAEECIESALGEYGGAWLQATDVRRNWEAYCNGASDNSYYVWQWISLGLDVNTDRRLST